MEEQDAELFGQFQDVDVSMISQKSNNDSDGNMAGNNSFLFSQPSTPKQTKVNAEEIDSLNPALIASLSIKIVQQNKPYCQLCFREFSILVRKYHCALCGRSCCNNCSDEKLPELKLNEPDLEYRPEKPLKNFASSLFKDLKNIKNMAKSDEQKLCEYCYVKMTNPQMEQFYQLGVLWRKKDEETLDMKIKWYQEQDKELMNQVEIEREGMVLDMDANERDCKQIIDKKQELKAQKEYLLYEKNRISEEAEQLSHQRDSLQHKVEQLRQQRQNLIFLKDKADINLTNKIAIKQELFRKFQELDEQEAQQKMNEQKPDQSLEFYNFVDDEQQK